MAERRNRITNLDCRDPKRQNTEFWLSLGYKKKACCRFGQLTAGKMGVNVNWPNQRTELGSKPTCWTKAMQGKRYRLAICRSCHDTDIGNATSVLKSTSL